jgi:hypothetical protein
MGRLFKVGEKIKVPKSIPFGGGRRRRGQRQSERGGYDILNELNAGVISTKRSGQSYE